MEWEYTTIWVDAWMDVGVQGTAKQELRELGRVGWEVFGVTPPTPPPGDGLDPDMSTYEILLKRRIGGG